jgi:hypothetical protein
MDLETANRLPTSEEVNIASSLKIFDHKGNEVTLGSLFAEQRTVIAFIRKIPALSPV